MKARPGRDQSGLCLERDWYFMPYDINVQNVAVPKLNGELRRVRPNIA